MEYLEKVQIEGNRKIRRKIKILNQRVIEEIGKRYNIEKLNKFKNWVENELLENRQKPIIFDEKPYEIVTFIDDELQIDVNVDVDNDTVWLSQEQIAMLFDKAISTINEHIKNILEEELDEKEVRGMHPAEKVELYLRQFGIVGYGNDAIRAVAAAYGVNLNI